MTLYNVFAYLAIFRMEELGFQKFRELALTQEPSKVDTFIDYIYNKDNLWNSLLSSWMTVRDLDYVEKSVIPQIEKFIPEMQRFRGELAQNAAEDEARKAAEEEAKAKGEVGLAAVTKRKGTRPVSPKLTKQRPPMITEPERIPIEITANPVPSNLDNTTMDHLRQQRIRNHDNAKAATLAKYNHEKTEFKFHETKGGRSKDDIRRELEEKATADLAFDSSYVHPPPDFNAVPAKVRVNAATILREDYLYRKQQAKDVQILKNYEEELRDPTEFYIWQADLKERDEQDKLNQVALRREQARQSAIDAKNAILDQQQDNATVAAMLREQARAIQKSKQIEQEMEIIKNQGVAQKIAEVRDIMPKIAVKKVKEVKVENGRKTREELEAARLKKEEEDYQLELVKADKIRQLKAQNTVHRKHIVVFDPTDVGPNKDRAGPLDKMDFNSEMSYMEMKVRRQLDLEHAEDAERLKREEIIKDKQRRATDLERRALSVARARAVKAEATADMILRKKEKEEKEKKAAEYAREQASIALAHELQVKREKSRAEKAALKAEEERVRRQQQYLGAAMGQVEETREEEQLKAKEREISIQQSRIREKAILDEESRLKDKKNRTSIIKLEKKEKKTALAASEAAVQFEKRASVEKMKATVVYKKEMFKTGQHQHEVTKDTLVKHNPYAASINDYNHSLILTQRSKSGTGRR